MTLTVKGPVLIGSRPDGSRFAQSIYADGPFLEQVRHLISAIPLEVLAEITWEVVLDTDLRSA